MTRTYRFNAAGELVEVGDGPREAWFIPPDWPPIPDVGTREWFDHIAMLVFADNEKVGVLR